MPVSYGVVKQKYTNIFMFDSLIFKNIAAMMGGNLRLILSGGAPLSAETHEKIKICMCADVVPGYGLTETTSGATVFDG